MCQAAAYQLSLAELQLLLFSSLFILKEGGWGQGHEGRGEGGGTREPRVSPWWPASESASYLFLLLPHSPGNEAGENEGPPGAGLASAPPQSSRPAAAGGPSSGGWWRSACCPPLPCPPPPCPAPWTTAPPLGSVHTAVTGTMTEKSEVLLNIKLHSYCTHTTVVALGSVCTAMTGTTEKSEVLLTSYYTAIAHTQQLHHLVQCVQP